MVNGQMCEAMIARRGRSSQRNGSLYGPPFTAISRWSLLQQFLDLRLCIGVVRRATLMLLQQFECSV